MTEYNFLTNDDKGQIVARRVREIEAKHYEISLNVRLLRSIEEPSDQTVEQIALQLVELQKLENTKRTLIAVANAEVTEVDPEEDVVLVDGNGEAVAEFPAEVPEDEDTAADPQFK